MYRDWPFFQMLLSNMDIVLAKSDIAIASRYAELVSLGHGIAQKRLFPIARGMAEHDRRVAEDHGAGELARKQSAIGPLDSQPFPVSRSAQSHADRAVEAL